MSLEPDMAMRGLILVSRFLSRLVIVITVADLLLTVVFSGCSFSFLASVIGRFHTRDG